MTKKKLPAKVESDIAERVGRAILEFIGRIPKSKARKSRAPLAVARNKANLAAAKAALTAGSLALPPGPIGWMTILPEMVGVWRIQAQLVADIARIYGKSAALTREQMLYCLFRHSAAQAVRDLVVRAGERFLVRKGSIRMIQSVTRRIGMRVTQRSIGSAVSRWLPFAGAVGVGAYAYYDTIQVASTAMHLFEADIVVTRDKEKT
jgi:hypothetical protein